VPAFLINARRHRPAAAPSPVAYMQDVSIFEKEYGAFHGKLLRDPELEREFQVANQFVQQENYTAAVEILEKASKNAGVPVIFHNLGSLYAAIGDRARSIGAFREALARDAEYWPVRDAIERLRMHGG
jgi:tetratricopeptide (TPR) repeat protein